MPWFKLYAGLGGGFGGEKHQATEFFETQSQADDAAYAMACEEYEKHEGLYGLRTISDIMEEDGVDEGEAEEIYREERESWIEYYTREATGPDDTDDE